MKKQYMAIDQYGQTHHIGRNPPRKWLLDHLCSSHCSKMYADLASGGCVHIGYIISGLWLTLYEVTPMERPA